MCETTKHIKLCTCGEVDDTMNNTWRLVLGSTSIQVVGEFFPPSDEPVDFNLGDYLEAKIVSDLNNCDAFDFDYKPKIDDTLTIRLDKREYHFAFDGEEFVSMPRSWFEDDGKLSKSGRVRLVE